MAAIDLIVSDVLMPGQTGPEMIAALAAALAACRRAVRHRLCGRAATRDGFGGHAVLRKPFTLAALERAIARCGDATAPRRSRSPRNEPLALTRAAIARL